MCDENVLDSKDHIFFRCSWSKDMFGLIAEWFNIKYIPVSMQDLYRWLKRVKDKREMKQFYVAIYSATAY